MSLNNEKLHFNESTGPRPHGKNIPVLGRERSIPQKQRMTRFPSSPPPFLQGESCAFTPEVRGKFHLLFSGL